MELSKRLYAVAGLVTEGASVADIGTDHGYVPIYLIKNKIAFRVIAMDINKGPLERAKMHIIGHGLKGQIETRLSDGLKKVNPGEVDGMIAAGMGGALVIKILEESKAVVDTLEFLILQPQSEISKVRKYLNKNGLVIIEEDMVEEEGKYYPMMKVIHGQPEEYKEYEYIYGKKLLEKKHPVLEKFLLREKYIQESIVEQLSKHIGSESAEQRTREILHERQYTIQALERFE